MSTTRRRRIVSLAACTTLASLAVSVPPSSGADGPTTRTGRSTNVAPYVVPMTDGVRTASLFTVDDGVRAGDGHDLVGVPDGMGAIRGKTGVVVYNNHEFEADEGEVHAHGQTGSFVSKMLIDPATGVVKSNTDLVTRVAHYDYTTGAYGATPSAGFTPQFNRFCSGSLSDPGVLYDKATRTGFAQQVYFGNEENGDTGRDFAILANGYSVHVPELGLASIENTLVANTGNQHTTVVTTEDGRSGQLRIYTGTKKGYGAPAFRAGLRGGTLHVLDVADQAVSDDAGFRAAYGKNKSVPATANLIDWKATGAAQNEQAAAQGISLTRIEDGAFDPTHPDDFYFLTTEGGDTTSVENDQVSGAAVKRDGGGLWRLRFADVSDPAKGMTLTLLLDGSEAPFLSKPDNMDIDETGHLMIQEDPGGNAHVARILAYEIATGRVKALAQFDPAHFASGATAYPATTDEESSGIIDLTGITRAGSFLFGAQVHTSTGLSDPTRQVQHGQILSMRVDWPAVFGTGTGDDYLRTTR